MKNQARPARIALACLAVLALPALSFAEAPDAFSEVAALIEAARKDWNAPGMSVAVVVDGKIVWAEGFGLADVENEVPARADTVYRIASISKPVAATAVMQLVEKGGVAIDDHITKYVPSFPNRDLGITLRHLMTHTSGIRHYNPGEFDLNDHFDSIEDAIEIFKDDPLLFTPGTQYSYSTYAYNLLAGVVERASGLTFDAYMKEKVWGPAGMTATRLEHQREIVPRRARQYVPVGGGQVENAPFADLSVKWAGGGMISTVEDLARFAIALDEGILLKMETLEKMYEPMTLADGSRTDYGLGWDSRIDEKGRRWIAHGGGATGGSTYLLRLPDERFAIAIAANVQDAGDRRALGIAIAERVLGR
ncbi:MAG: serine hydrolase domain-containing protein [Vicinamibacteria bacterium]